MAEIIRVPAESDKKKEILEELRKDVETEGDSLLGLSELVERTSLEGSEEANNYMCHLCHEFHAVHLVQRSHNLGI